MLDSVRLNLKPGISESGSCWQNEDSRITA
jgi:hypothetical protein